ncbi:TetR-like C-terminal domain-containing protein [Streptomyces collinus]|uniref:TetR family transcriptional regulator n=1 Tax=Streptomyces collinus (strain DSM 40733 / Tue 365) TaxID=1214242 RepID=S5V307_STRC3|nr:TetR family transcriptional regulator [Streptomyces collinus Tu 365]UJA10902.1 TetR/AcrR family transcriptional regulator [Streptomyces collinus]UJA14234.1 TetR/AcrR family transcriptional regulator [Streptomyces collinus]
MIFDGVVEPTIQQSRDVVTRGKERGEVRPDAADGYVLDAIPAMMMHRSKMCRSEWSDRDLEEMVDHLMIPLLRPHGS